MRALRQAKRKHLALLEQLRRPALESFVRALPNRAETQDGHLPGVPVAQPVKGQNLVELAIAPRVPAAVGVAVARGCQEVVESLVLFLKLDKVGVPDSLAVVGLELALALVLKELDGFEHDLPRAFVWIIAAVFLGIQENHGALLC